MLIDLASSLIAYVAITLAFGEAASAGNLAIGVVAALSPDCDYAIYACVRNKFAVISHRFVHYPLAWLTGALAFGYLSGDWYRASLAAAGFAIHFVHDSYGWVGIQWLWPFMPKAYISFGRGGRGFQIMTPETRRSILHYRYGHELRQGFWDVFWGRLRDEFTNLGFTVEIYLILSFTVVCVFFLLYPPAS